MYPGYDSCRYCIYWSDYYWVSVQVSNTIRFPPRRQCVLVWSVLHDCSHIFVLKIAWIQATIRVDSIDRTIYWVSTIKYCARILQSADKIHLPWQILVSIACCTLLPGQVLHPQQHNNCSEGFSCTLFTMILSVLSVNQTWQLTNWHFLSSIKIRVSEVDTTWIILTLCEWCSDEFWIEGTLLDSQQPH